MSPRMKIDALLSLKSDGRLLVGRDRVAVLESVAHTGSITEAAKVLGISYKSAWDAVAAINNLMPRPALLTQTGGRRGGGAIVTDEGRRLIIAFRRLEEKLAQISAMISKDGIDVDSELLFWSLSMKTSARNVFHGIVVDIRKAQVNVEVTLRVSEQHSIIAVITNDSAQELGIVVGREAVALVKSSFVMLARPEPALKISTSNRFDGTVVDRLDGGVNSEIVIDIGHGKTLASVITAASADEMKLCRGEPISAFFNASQVILAVD